jgi:hypothetical protein
MSPSDYVAVITQIGLAAAAYRLAHQLKKMVEVHEKRITALEEDRKR